MERNDKKFQYFDDAADDDNSDWEIDLEELFAKTIEVEDDDTTGDSE